MVDAHVAAGGAAVLGWPDQNSERIVVRKRDGTVPLPCGAVASDPARPASVPSEPLQAAALAWALDLPAPARLVPRSIVVGAAAAAPLSTKEVSA